MTPFTLMEGDSPLLLSIPHAGTDLTPEVADRLTPAARPLSDTDWHIPQLYDFAHGLGASVLAANYSRFVIDLNRPADDQPLYTTATTGLFPDILFDGTQHLHPAMRRLTPIVPAICAISGILITSKSNSSWHALNSATATRCYSMRTLLRRVFHACLMDNCQT